MGVFNVWGACLQVMAVLVGEVQTWFVKIMLLSVMWRQYLCSFQDV